MEKTNFGLKVTDRTKAPIESEPSLEPVTDHYLNVPIVEPHQALVIPPISVSQPYVDSGSQSSDFVADTIKGNVLVTSEVHDTVEALVYRNFLRNSWAILADEDVDDQAQVIIHSSGNDAFTSAIMNLKWKQKKLISNQKYGTRSQARLINLTL